jgi:arylsulfatase A-like enzyme
VLAAAEKEGEDRRMAKRPNVLIFMTDQEQAQVSLPGHPCATPNADRLAAEGIRFTRAYTPAPHCCPSRATFMTGLYPAAHGVYNNVANATAIRTGLRPGVRTFGEGLAEAGYRMLYTGRWHVSDDEGPGDRGWEERAVTAGKGASATWSRLDVAHVPPSAPPDQREPGVILRPGWGDYRLYQTLDNPTPRAYDHGGDWDVVTEALRCISEVSRGDQPWCLYVGLNGPHDPYRVPEEFVRRYDPAQVQLPLSFTDDLADKPRIYGRQRRQVWGQLSESETREAVAHYWAYCEMQDVYLGLLLDALEASGQRDDTLVLKLADHGEYAAAHGLFMKGVPSFDEGARIPLIASWRAGMTNPGRDEDSFTGLVDIAPTLLELAGAAGGESLQGRSLTSFFAGERPDDWPDERCSQFNGAELYYTQRVVQTREHKYVYNGFDLDELYDLRADPAEVTNLAEDPDYEDVKRDLVRRMWRFAQRTGDHIFSAYPTVALAPWGPGDALTPAM